MSNIVPDMGNDLREDVIYFIDSINEIYGIAITDIHIIWNMSHTIGDRPKPLNVKEITVMGS